MSALHAPNGLAKLSCLTAVAESRSGTAVDKRSEFASPLLFWRSMAMRHKRPVEKGSFGAHFDELVKHFPHSPRNAQPAPRSSERACEDLKEKLDIHALLFERAWGLDEKDDRAR